MGPRADLRGRPARGGRAARRPAGRFTLQAAIAALHAQSPSYAQTDWPQILTLYDELLRIWPSPVVALHRAVVVSMVDGPQAALALSDNAAEQEFLAGRVRSFER